MQGKNIVDAKKNTLKFEKEGKKVRKCAIKQLK